MSVRKNNTKKRGGKLHRAEFIYQEDFGLSATAATTAAAYAGEQQQSDDDKPYNLIIEKIAKAVHSVFLSSQILRIEIRSRDESLHSPILSYDNCFIRVHSKPTKIFRS